MSLQSLADAFVDELRDVYSAEKQLLKALPKMAKKATHPMLKQAFENHLSETEGQVERVEKVFESLELKARAKTCEAMQGLLEEGKSIMEEDAEPEVLDAMLIAAAQKVEHYEMATYGTLCAWAKVLGYDEALALLKQTMEQEVKADSLLTKLADGSINATAAEMASS